MRGIRGTANRRWSVELDRADGDPRCAIAEAQPGDVVLIAGKGHEDYQETQRRAPAVLRRARSPRAALAAWSGA